jgi:two-component system, cell cycle sensor histidine kinase and response regulator CckA
MSERHDELGSHQFKYDVARAVAAKATGGRPMSRGDIRQSGVWWNEPSATESDPEPDAEALATKRVLLVDDDPTLRRHGSLLLQTLGYEVVVCADGFAALDAVLHSPQGFDLLFTDISMPGMDGRVLASRVQTLRPEIKVLFTSGFSKESLFPSPGEYGQIRFLRKPYTVNALASSIRQMFND